jgi:hypothetical protein
VIATGFSSRDGRRIDRRDAFRVIRAAPRFPDPSAARTPAEAPPDPPGTLRRRAGTEPESAAGVSFAYRCGIIL